jgi:large subunit ribosomal protein L18
MNKIYLYPKKRLIKKIIGTSNVPRLSIFKSHKHIYAQLINDLDGFTICACSTIERTIALCISNSSTKVAAFLVGQELAKKASRKNITKIVFDRGYSRYAGRIKSLVLGARQSGLIF